MSNYTPGPWHYNEDPEQAGIFETHGAKAICWLDNAPRVSENARLIAAAPDLLEALKTICNELNKPDCAGLEEPTWSKLCSIRHHAQAAIAKAEGGAE